MTPNNTFSHVLKYTGLMGAVQVLGILISVVRGKLTALLIGVAGVGLADIYNRSAELMGNSTNLGVSFSAVRRISKLHERGQREALARYVCLVRSWTVWTAAAGLLLTLLLSPLLSWLAFGSLAAVKYFLCLAPMVATLTLLGSELALLKGMRRLRALAYTTVLSALCSLLITAPLYWLLGTRGIVPVLVVTTLAVLCVTLRATTRLVPWRVRPFSWRFIRSGGHLLHLGVAYIAAGVLGSGAELLVRLFMVRTASVYAAGLYAAGLTLTVSYARLVFASMDSDFFPRLSAAVGRGGEASQVVCRQIDVLVMLMAPFLIVFCAALPVAVPLLYTGKFLGVIPMVLCAAFYMYFKAVCQPIAMLSLAHADSWVYLLMELLYDAAFVVLVSAGFLFWGVAGAGVGLSLAYGLELLLIWTVYARRYHFSMERSTLLRLVPQGLCLLSALLFLSRPEAWLHWGGAALALCASAALSLGQYFKREDA